MIPNLPWRIETNKDLGIHIKDGHGKVIVSNLRSDYANYIIHGVNITEQAKQAFSTLRLIGYTWGNGEWVRLANKRSPMFAKPEIPEGSKSYEEWQSAGYQVVMGNKSMHRRPDGKAVFTPDQVKRIMSREEELQEFVNQEDYREYERFREEHHDLPAPGLKGQAFNAWWEIG